MPINNNINKKRLKFYLCIIGIIIIILIIIASIVFSRVSKPDIKTEKNNNEGITLFDTKLSEYVKETEDGVKINISSQLNQDKKIDGLTVSNIQLTAVNGIATLLADVINNTATNSDLKNIEAVFVDENGKELFSAKGIISPLKVGDTTRLNISMSSNCITAYDILFK